MSKEKNKELSITLNIHSLIEKIVIELPAGNSDYPSALQRQVQSIEHHLTTRLIAAITALRVFRFVLWLAVCCSNRCTILAMRHCQSTGLETIIFSIFAE